jgi:hypothetical protein
LLLVGAKSTTVAFGAAVVFLLAAVLAVLVVLLLAMISLVYRVTKKLCKTSLFFTLLVNVCVYFKLLILQLYFL